MIYRRQKGIRVITIVLWFVLLGFAQGSGAGELESATEDGSDVIDVMDEIVVIGRKKKQRPDFSHIPGIESIVNMPGWLRWDLLPTYDLERAIRRFELLPLTQRAISREGNIELFRISFGRRQHE